MYPLRGLKVSLAEKKMAERWRGRKNVLQTIDFRISNVVVCIDDVHIPIITPFENETDYCMEWKDARWKDSEVTTTTSC